MSEKQAVYAGEPKRHPITLTVGEPYEGELPGPPAPLELERVYDAEIPRASPAEVPSLEDLKSEWTAGAETKIRGQLRQARAAYLVKEHYGAEALRSFATEMDRGRSTVYEYAKIYGRLLEFFPDHEAVSERLDESPLTIWHVVEASKRDDISFPEALDEAEIEGHTTRQQKAIRKEREKPENVETITVIVCPECGCESPMSRVETRTEVALL